MPPAELVTRQPINVTRSTGLYQLPTSKKWFNRSFDRCKSTSPFEKIEASLFRVLSNMLPTLARPLTMPPWDNSHKRNVQRSRVSSRFGVSSQKKPTVCGIFAFRTPHKSQVLKQLDLQLTGQPQIWKKKLARSSTERRDPLKTLKKPFGFVSIHILSIREPKYPWHPRHGMGHLSRSLCPLPRRR